MLPSSSDLYWDIKGMERRKRVGGSHLCSSLTVTLITDYEAATLIVFFAFFLFWLPVLK